MRVGIRNQLDIFLFLYCKAPSLTPDNTFPFIHLWKAIQLPRRRERSCQGHKRRGTSSVWHLEKSPQLRDATRSYDGLAVLAINYASILAFLSGFRWDSVSFRKKPVRHCTSCSSRSCREALGWAEGRGTGDIYGRAGGRNALSYFDENSDMKVNPLRPIRCYRRTQGHQTSLQLHRNR